MKDDWDLNMKNFDFENFAKKILTDFNKINKLSVQPEQQKFEDWKKQNEEEIFKKVGEKK